MTRFGKRFRVLPALVLLVVLFHPGGAAAYDSAFDRVIGNLRDMVSDFFTDLLDPLTQSTVDSVTRVSPAGFARGMESRSRFLQHLSDAGYNLVEIDMSVGLIPGAQMKFQIVRELSHADYHALERSLAIDERKSPGLTAMAQRQIIRTLLAVSRSREMRVGKLVVGILPLPSAEFSIESAEAPLSEEHNVLLQALRSKAEELRADPHKVPPKK